MKLFRACEQHPDTRARTCTGAHQAMMAARVKHDRTNQRAKTNHGGQGGHKPTAVALGRAPATLSRWLLILPHQRDVI
jgi:hypothetical protein